MNHTTNYNLPQWEDADRVTRADMNAAMSAIDTALAGTGRIVVGSYVGNGTYGSSHKNSLTFDFEPKLVVLCGRGPAPNGPSLYLLLWGVTNMSSYGADSTATYDHRLYANYTDRTVEWFNTISAENQLNKSGDTYYYLVVG